MRANFKTISLNEKGAQPKWAGVLPGPGMFDWLYSFHLVHLFADTMTFGRQSIWANGVAKKRNIPDIAYFPRFVIPATEPCTL